MSSRRVRCPAALSAAAQGRMCATLDEGSAAVSVFRFHAGASHRFAQCQCQRADGTIVAAGQETAGLVGASQRPGPPRPGAGAAG
jgi:hypothetical protein